MLGYIYLYTVGGERKGVLSKTKSTVKIWRAKRI